MCSRVCALPADAAGGHCAVSVYHVGSPLRKRDPKSLAIANAGAGADLKRSLLTSDRTSPGSGDCGAGPEAGGGPSFHFGKACATPPRKDGPEESKIEALQRSFANEPFKTVFVNLEASAEHFCVRNLDTGETRRLDGAGSDLTDSFLEGVGALPGAMPPTFARPWCGWWAEKRAKDDELIEAARRGDLAAVEVSLAAPSDGAPAASVNAVAPDGRTALCVAAAVGHEHISEALLRARADIHAQSRGGAAALHLACVRGSSAVVRQLLAAGANPLAKTADGSLAAHLAATGGHAKTLDLLLAHGSGCEQLRARSQAGQLPADSATSVEALQILARYDSRRTSDSYAFRTPFASGAVLLRNSRSDVVRAILDKVRNFSGPVDDQRDGLSSSQEEPMSSPEHCVSTTHRRLQSFETRTPSSARVCTPQSSCQGTPRASPRVRGPFVRIRSSSSTVERVGPNSFELVKLLGRGSFGEVFQVKHKRTDEVFAMKVLQKSRIIGKNLQRYAMTERNILAYVRHPYIVQLHYAFQTTSHLVLVLQYCPRGNLQHLISREKRLPEPLARLYTAEILLALCHLHDRQTVFRDLKPDNVVIDEEEQAMLTDFGLSKEGVGIHGTRSFCGSVAFLAPEILMRREHGHTVDVYNLGVLLYDMLTGLPPYYHHDRETLFANIRHARLDVPRYVHPQAKALIEALMAREPTRRMGAKHTSEIQAHAFFAGLDFGALLRREVPVPAPQQPSSRASAPAASDNLGRRAASPLFRGAGGTPESPFSRQDRACSRRGSAPCAGAISGWEFTALPPPAAASPAPSPPRQVGGTPAKSVQLRLPGMLGGAGSRSKRDAA
mmetsp:Transcript_63524/g.184199  ORF Transcript_63524/g.184199 Transcript_63524/m.184199 type:complete len:840 (+) Transcript_63524:63-2582(+)